MRARGGSGAGYPVPLRVDDSRWVAFPLGQVRQAEGWSLRAGLERTPMAGPTFLKAGNMKSMKGTKDMKGAERVVGSVEMGERATPTDWKRLPDSEIGALISNPGALSITCS